jgi:hypothetical protein
MTTIENDETIDDDDVIDEADRDRATDEVDDCDDYEIERASVALFSRDEGTLTREQRGCLVYLLKNHYLSHDQKPAVWQTLMENQPLIRSRLNDLFLTLHVDLEGQVAYKRQAVPDHGGAAFPTLLHDRAYNREQTILLVYLRERLHRQRAGNEGQVLVDREDMLDRVAEFRADDDTDVYGAQKRAENAIDALKSMGVLYDNAESERFTIAPVLDSLLPLPRLQELLEWLRSETGQVEPIVVDDERDGS